MRTLFLSLLLSFCMAPGHAQQWNNFTDTAGYFTASYPDNWTLKIKEGNHVFFTSPKENDNDGFRQNVNIAITVSPAFEGMKIIELAPDILKSLETRYNSYTFLGSNNFAWNGLDAVEIRYSFKQDGSDVLYRIKQWLCIKHDALYVGTYTAPDTPDDAFANTGTAILNYIKF